MKFTTAFLAAVLSASALAAPYNSPAREARRARREARAASGTHVPKPFVRANVTSGEINGPENIIQTEYSTNWAGAALVGTGYTAVYGTFVIPSISLPSGGSSTTEYSASAWVGLDGYTCSTAIAQTGIDFNYQGGKITFDAWYEWYPDYAYTFSGISFSVGDTVTLSVVASSKTAGKVTVKNVTTGKSVSHSFSGESDALCETNAEWIVEDYTEVSSTGAESLVPLVNFGTVTFTNAYATTSSGKVGVSGAEIVDLINSSKKVIASSSVSGDSTVIVKYIG